MAQTPNLSGSYTYDPGASQNIAAAIKKVTSQMFFGSGMATDRLTKTNQPPQKLVITQTASDITIQADNGQAIKTTMNGTPARLHLCAIRLGTVGLSGVRRSCRDQPRARSIATIAPAEAAVSAAP